RGKGCAARVWASSATCDPWTAGSAVAAFRSRRAGRVERRKLAARGAGRSVAVAADAKSLGTGATRTRNRTFGARFCDTGCGTARGADALAQAGRLARCRFALAATVDTVDARVEAGRCTYSAARLLRHRNGSFRTGARAADAAARTCPAGCVAATQAFRH